MKLRWDIIGVTILFILGFGVMILFVKGVSNIKYTEKITYTIIEDSGSSKVYVCNPRNVWIGGKFGHKRISFTDTNGVIGNLTNYIILQRGNIETIIRK